MVRRTKIARNVDCHSWSHCIVDLARDRPATTATASAMLLAIHWELLLMIVSHKKPAHYVHHLWFYSRQQFFVAYEAVVMSLNMCQQVARSMKIETGHDDIGSCKCSSHIKNHYFVAWSLLLPQQHLAACSRLEATFAFTSPLLIIIT